MVRKTFWVTLLASALIVVMAGAASAAPPAMTLSSWESDAIDGAIVGGTRTITVTNITDVTLSGHTVDVTTVPCVCGLTDSSAAAIDGETWNVPDLAPYETATITLDYEPSVVSAGSAAPPASLDETLVLAALALGFMSLMALPKPVYRVRADA